MILKHWLVGFLANWNAKSTTCSSERIVDPFAKVSLNFFPIGLGSTFNRLARCGEMNECELPESTKKVKGLSS